MSSSLLKLHIQLDDAVQRASFAKRIRKLRCCLIICPRSLRIAECKGLVLCAIKADCDFQVGAAVMNHGSFTNREEVDAVKQPFLVNASDKDQLLSRERLAQYQGALDCKKNVPSDVKVIIGQLLCPNFHFQGVCNIKDKLKQAIAPMLDLVESKIAAILFVRICLCSFSRA